MGATVHLQDHSLVNFDSQWSKFRYCLRHTWALQLWHKIRRTLILAHEHNKHLTIPGHNHHCLMIENPMLNTIDNKAVASKTLRTPWDWGLSREIGLVGDTSCGADCGPPRQKPDGHRCAPFQLCYRTDLARIYCTREGRQEVHPLFQHCHSNWFNIESQELIWFEIFPITNVLNLSTFEAFALGIDVIVILVSTIFSAFAWNNDKGCFKQGKTTSTLLGQLPSKRTKLFDKESVLSRWRASTSLAYLFFSADKTQKSFANF